MIVKKKKYRKHVLRLNINMYMTDYNINTSTRISSTNEVVPLELLSQNLKQQ